MGECVSKHPKNKEKGKTIINNHNNLQGIDLKAEELNISEATARKSQKVQSNIKNGASNEKNCDANSDVKIEEEGGEVSNLSAPSTSQRNSQKNFALYDDGDIRSTNMNFLPFGNKSSILKPRKQYVCGLTVILEDSLANEVESQNNINQAEQRPKRTLSALVLKNQYSLQKMDESIQKLNISKKSSQIPEQSQFQHKTDLKISFQMHVEIFPQQSSIIRNYKKGKVHCN